ncbi:mannosyl-oligosaccharide glucosidase-like [Oppia nitens]|uniref:mannosyl-oligosaccharide glucosidase-like n=1 Tax=Oppia nitens TaxID=1686743 RepID=UPI0023DA7EFB|nr:mannosyl-oligosaccharide glucosidase-like [Oppia nitens]
MEPILPYNTWGTFRGLYYFGLRTTQPDSPAIGLMWFKNTATDVGHLQIRHLCQDVGGLVYGWKRHNFQDFGLQTIRDGNYHLNTSFVKHTSAGTDWSTLVSVDSTDKIDDNNSAGGESMSVIMYISLTRDRDDIRITGFNTSSLTIRGYNEFIGNFTLEISADSNNKQSLLYVGQLACNATIIETTGALKQNLIKMKINGTDIYGLKQGSTPPTPTRARLIAYQVVFKGSVNVRSNFSSKTKSQEIMDNSKQLTTGDYNSYETDLQNRIKQFDREFDEKFPLKGKGFTDNQIDFAKSVISEMLGSIGYFNGNLSVDSPGMPSPKTYGPLQILSAVPSRPVFPRPFLWDEGFHNLVIQWWNSSLTTTIMKSWFNLMNIDGWIPREITIGAESLDRFHGLNTQRDVNANPPAFLLTIDTLMRRQAVDNGYLKDIYPRLQSWFHWYNTSQSGSKPGTYRWRGRWQNDRELNPSTLTSGLDDYPRATHPTNDEYHLDLRCWMWLAADVMTRIANAVGDTSMKAQYKATADMLADNRLLESLHWSDVDKAYCDYGYHSTNVSLEKQPSGQYVRKVWTPPKYQHTCDQLGYVNLFPLMFGLIEANNTRLGHVFEVIGNRSLMGSPYGLSSLSKTSFYYMKQNNIPYGVPYWRGPIWININYLVLRALNRYSGIDGPYKQRAGQLYRELRQQIIDNMFGQYEKSGFVWEQYNDRSGLGQRSHPFVGWSGVVLLIMTESY